MNDIYIGSLLYFVFDDEGEIVVLGLEEDNFKVSEGKLVFGIKRICE